MTGDKNRLLAAILANQIEDGDGDRFDADATLHRLRSKGALSEENRLALLSSPAVRARMQEALGAADAALTAEAGKLEIELQVLPRVAAADDDRVTTIEAKGWRLSIYREDLPHMIYSLTLQLGDELCGLAPGYLRLVDSGNHCWLEGKPDARAEITAPWSLDAEAPMSRLAQYALRLEILSM